MRPNGPGERVDNDEHATDARSRSSDDDDLVFELDGTHV